MNKGQLIELVYGKDYSNIDTAIPKELFHKVNPRIHVMNYNNSITGDLENMIKVAQQKGIQLPELKILDQEYNRCMESNEYFYNNYCRKEGEPWYTEQVFRDYKKKVHISRAITPYQEFKKYYNGE